MDRTEFINICISKETGCKLPCVIAVTRLLAEKATIPFIARYRKERTGGLDETVIRNISEKLEYYQELEKRRETILKTIEEQGKLTEELAEKIKSVTDKNTLEDIYLPYKPKKRTKASIAREKGLEGLAELIFLQLNINGSREQIISKFINPELSVNSEEEALSGACDIIAEKISEIPEVRQYIREIYLRNGKIITSVKKEWKDKPSKFQDYYDFSEPVFRSAGHRILAMRRGDAEGVISVKITGDSEKIISELEKKLIKKPNFMFAPELLHAIKDSCERLIFPSVENEVFSQKLESAEKEAIRIFSENLKHLLLAAPAGEKTVMGIDPGFRTGCKIAVVDASGNFLFHQAVFPHEPHNRKQEAEKIICEAVKKFGVVLIAAGNGTASRETDAFVRAVVAKNGLNAKYVSVSEAGASVYSASELAIKEFPDLDVTVRGAVSIARRLQDPLSELVKIDPKSIGVGQYQHDVDQKELKKSLDLTVESCVNHVGVQLNTASAELLKHVSGIGPVLAQNIVRHRAENGPFSSRKMLRKVPKLGEKAFEQCAGFLRIRGASDPLDDSAIHPEAYHLVKKMAADLEKPVSELIGTDLDKKISLEKYISEDFGLPTLQDILKELKKPGLDPREEFRNVEFSEAICTPEDLKEGMVLDGIVTNVTSFGAFVDIGVHQDGLVHISKLAKRFIKDPAEIVSSGDRVRVKVLAVNLELKRISLEKLEN